MSRRVPYQTFERDMPWVVYTYLTSDRRTRITGRSHIECCCSICGQNQLVKIRIPRLGPVPEPASGRHPQRECFLAGHRHPDKAHNRLLWMLPLRNVAAWPP